METVLASAISGLLSFAGAYLLFRTQTNKTRADLKVAADTAHREIIDDYQERARYWREQVEEVRVAAEKRLQERLRDLTEKHTLEMERLRTRYEAEIQKFSNRLDLVERNQNGGDT